MPIPMRIPITTITKPTGRAIRRAIPQPLPSARMVTVARRPLPLPRAGIIPALAAGAPSTPLPLAALAGTMLAGAVQPLLGAVGMGGAVPTGVPTPGFRGRRVRLTRDIQTGQMVLVADPRRRGGRRRRLTRVESDALRAQAEMSRTMSTVLILSVLGKVHT